MPVGTIMPTPPLDDGVIMPSRSQLPTHSTFSRFVHIKRWRSHVSVRLPLENTDSASDDSAAIERISIAMWDKGGYALRWSSWHHHLRGEPSIFIGAPLIKASKLSVSPDGSSITEISIWSIVSSLGALWDEEGTSPDTSVDANGAAELYSSSQILRAPSMAGACYDLSQLRSMYLLRFEGSRRRAAAYTGISPDRV